MNKPLAFLVTLPLILALSSPVLAASASLELKPSSITIDVGKTHTFNLHLDPDGASIIGVDVFLTFDPAVLRINSITSTGVFNSLPATIIDNPAGKSKFSLANSFGVYQKTPANIADITVEILKPTTSTSLNFDFIAGKTTDTNVVTSGGVDLLTSVTSATITISPGNPANPTSTPPPAITSSPTPTPKPKKSSHKPSSPPGQILGPAGETSSPPSPPISSPLPSVKHPQSISIYFYLSILLGLINLALIAKILKSKFTSKNSLPTQVLPGDTLQNQVTSSGGP